MELAADAFYFAINSWVVVVLHGNQFSD